MKSFLLVLTVFSTTLAACNNNPAEEKKGTLPSSLVNNPRTADGLDTKSAAEKPTMDFDDTVHTFSKITEGEVVSHEFTFKNNGKSPLIITSASGSCGCTVPEYPKDPIQPGKTGTLKVTFNSKGKNGHQEKSVTIFTNSFRGVHMLYIKGEVDKK